jgi:predicted Fe-S protein YdhL (DUF1289 family)
MFAADAAPRATMIESPCVKICSLDARSGQCLGCGRTIDEIARWTDMGGGERTRVMGELQWRMAASRHADPPSMTG